MEQQTNPVSSHTTPTRLERVRPWATRIALIVALVGLASWGLHQLFDTGPSERNRIVHPHAGYSIIKPEGWREKYLLRPEGDEVRDGIFMDPLNWVGRAPTMWIKRLSNPPDLEKLRDTGYVEQNFQGRPAWISQQKPKKDLVRTVVFERNGDWFSAGVSLPGLEGLNVEKWWGYVESARP